MVSSARGSVWRISGASGTGGSSCAITDRGMRASSAPHGSSSRPERLVHGSDPTLTDTDGDTLSDYREVTLRLLELAIDGLAESRRIVTSPSSVDTDGDGLRDEQEWNGLSLYGFLTDPSDPDTDHEGLSDFDEVIGANRRPTNPLESDTDGDGLVDSLDLSPTELVGL